MGSRTDDNLLQLKFNSYWKDLKQNDLLLADFINGGLPKSGNIVLANMLYVLNNEIDPDLRDTFKLFGLPESVFSVQQMLKLLKTVTNQAGHVEVDGILSQDSPYAGLDPNWIELFISYVAYQAFPQDVASFGNSPRIHQIDTQPSLTIALMGDWGSGTYDDFGNSSPSALVGKGISSLQPDITIHLGDVYYAGSSEQMKTKLLQNFPQGKAASYTMNGNHEMFDGANGYFKTALTNALFSAQQQTSYFAILYYEYIILGLDTAYYDDSLYHLQGAIKDDQQIEFIKSLDVTDNHKIILLTHHAGLSFDGSEIRKPLFDQVYQALGNRYPDYWYYGHIHNGIVYNNESEQGQYKTPSGKCPQLRCMGHGAVPIGKAHGLHDEHGRRINGIDYYADTPMPNPKQKAGIEKRVLNGFATITLTDQSMVERVYEVSEKTTAELVWSSV